MLQQVFDDFPQQATTAILSLLLMNAINPKNLALPMQLVSKMWVQTKANQIHLNQDPNQILLIPTIQVYLQALIPPIPHQIHLTISPLDQNAQPHYLNLGLALARLACYYCQWLSPIQIIQDLIILQISRLRASFVGTIPLPIMNRYLRVSLTLIILIPPNRLLFFDWSLLLNPTKDLAFMSFSELHLLYPNLYLILIL